MYKARQHLSHLVWVWHYEVLVRLWQKEVLLETVGGGHIRTASPENNLTAKTRTLWPAAVGRVLLEKPSHVCAKRQYVGFYGDTTCNRRNVEWPLDSPRDSDRHSTREWMVRGAHTILTTICQLERTDRFTCSHTERSQCQTWLWKSQHGNNAGDVVLFTQIYHTEQC